MKTKFYYTNLLLTVILLMVIVAGLINTDYFYSPSSTAFYAFCFSVFALIILTPPHLYLTHNKGFNLHLPIVIFGLWCVYVVSKYFSGSATSLFTFYFIVHFLFIISTTKIICNPTFNLKNLFIGIAAIATIETLFCISQYIGWFKSQNELFEVTGSCFNPNSTAMFLALATPVFLYLFQSKHKRLFQTAFFFILIALLLLKCRAAYIGVIASLIVFYSLESNFILWLKNKKNQNAIKALVVLSLLILIPTSIHLYNSKKASADGRKFIWKLSTMMVSQKPFTGYGYGYFSKEYNLFQADYIQKGNATITEMENAGHPFMAHNEYIQNAVEGGIVGLILMLLFFGTLLISIKKLKNQNSTQTEKSLFNLSYAGSIAFLVMAFFNFSIQNTPVMGMLSFYTAIICSSIKPIHFSKNLGFITSNQAIAMFLKMSTILICLFLAFTLFGIAKADHLNKKAETLKKERQYEQALIVMPALERHLNEDSDYWKNYGNLLYQMQDYQQAIECLHKAQKYDSSPALYLGLGICNEELHQYPTAITYFTQLVNLKPSKFRFRSRLMKAYLLNNDTVNTLKTAHGIINLKPKIPSKKVQFYKNESRKMIRQLSKESHNQNQVTI